MNNNPIQNYDLFDSILGSSHFDTFRYNKSYMFKVYKSLMLRQKELRKEYKKIIKIYKSGNCKDEKHFCSNNIKYNGFIYHCNYIMKINPTKPIDSIRFLGEINEDYCKTKIHELELELCFVNKNLKRFHKYYQSHKNIYDAMNLVNND